MILPPEMRLTDLPPEVLLEILSLVPTVDLLQNVARVSKMFYEYTKDPRAHIDVKFDMQVRFDSEQIWFFKQNSLYLEGLKVVAIFGVSLNL